MLSHSFHRPPCYRCRVRVHYYYHYYDYCACTVFQVTIASSRHRGTQEYEDTQTGNGNSRITLTAEQFHRGPFPVATWTPGDSWRSSIASLGPIEYQMPYRAEGWYLRLRACTWGSCSRSSSPEERSGTGRTWRPQEPPSSSRIAFVGSEVPLMVVRWTRTERWWTLDGFPLSASLKSQVDSEKGF